MQKDRKLAVALIALALVVFGLLGASSRTDDPTRPFYNLAHDRSVSIGQGLTILRLDIRETDSEDLHTLLLGTCKPDAGWTWPSNITYPLILTRNGSAESLMLERPNPRQTDITYSRPTRWTDYTLTWRGWR